jgi:hypothetical protein
MLANFTFDHSDEIDFTGDNLTDLIKTLKNGQNNRHRLCKPELNLSHRLGSLDIIKMANVFFFIKSP